MARRILDMAKDKLGELFSKTDQNFQELYDQDEVRRRAIRDTNDRVSALAEIVNNLPSTIGGGISQVLVQIPIAEDSWHENAEESIPFPIYCDIAVEGVTESMVPQLNILPISLDTAAECGFSPAVQSLDGIVRVYALTIPKGEIHANLAILGATAGTAGGGGTGGGSYVLPIATSQRLGGVKIGKGIHAEVDGTISTSGEISPEQLATTEEVNQVLKEVFGK